MTLSENALKVAEFRYFKQDSEGKPLETWEDCCRRVAKAAASVEVNGQKGFWEEQFFGLIYDMKFLPGGRILRNAGTYLNKCHNCHVLPLDDSIQDIGRFLHKALVLNAEGGGVGFLVNLRPKGAPIKGKGGKSSGLMSFLNIISVTLDVVESGGARRSGALPIVPITHPEVVDFINAKLNGKLFNNFNVSVGITNEFLDAVEQKQEWAFKFGKDTYGSMSATELFDLIVANMLKSGEPGIVNLDNMRVNNSWYFAPVSALNLCGELPLHANASCCLGSIVLPNFTSGDRTRWDEMMVTIHTLVRFLDNMLDVNDYSFPEMKEATLACRRIGVGVIGLADYLFSKKVKYGSDIGIDKTDDVIRFLRNEVYKASIELAKEKGVFPGYNEWSYNRAKFITTLPGKIRMEIKKHGVRNCTLMAMAPTGTLSLLCDSTSGIEPLFAKAYKKVDGVGERIYIHHILKDIVKEEGSVPDWFVDSYDLTPVEHFETSAAISRVNDGASSKTINLPKDTSHEQLASYLLEYARELIGITVYVDGTRGNQPLQRLSNDEILKELSKAMTTQDEQDTKCKSGVCGL